MFAPASIPSPGLEWRVLVDLGDVLRDLGLSWVTFDLPIRSYAICILIGIFAAALLTNARLNRRGAEPGVTLDVAFFALIFGVIGARIYHVLTHPDDYFFAGADPWAVIAIWDGGIAIFGALLGGALGVFIGCRLVGLRFWTYADALAPGLLLAQAFGRLGNWFNQELYGVPTDLPWGLEIDQPNGAFPAGLPDDTLFHPTFLYEIVWNLAGVAVLLLAERKFARIKTTVDSITSTRIEPLAPRLQWGRLLGLYLVWYGLGRAVFESIRIDPSEIILGVRVNVWAAFAAIVVGLLIIIIQGRRHPGAEPSAYLPGREWKPEAGLDSEDTYSDTADDSNSDGDSAPAMVGSSAAPPSATSGGGAKK
ncbi:prolipoprotein diacylglyceryl transferase [Marisediminicola sp. LYQ85]|uniref:prolipoprotein diacylglyceryl transferase n=1 Tax=Marisediminicola sp. LYQ85 TaxID=3391062 RepID=UPI0039830119